MLMLTIFIGILFVHWVADFVLQSDWMAKNKSSSNKALLMHVGTYTGVIAVAALLIFSGNIVLALAWALLNGGLHFITDYYTSRWSSRLWAEGQVHNFFVVIGLDQFIHAACLGITFMLFFSI